MFCTTALLHCTTLIKRLIDQKLRCAKDWVSPKRHCKAPALASGQLVPLLEEYNPQDREAIHAVFIGGKNTPARIRVFVDYLVEKMAGTTKTAD